MSAKDPNTPNTMRAWIYTSAAGSVGLERALTLHPAAPLPPLAADELLVRVHAASLNPADYKVPELGLVARLIVSPPATPGLDFAGIVARTSSSSSPFQPGDRVFGRVAAPTRHGALAEYVVARASGCAALPEGLGMEEASCLGTAGLTAYQSIAPHVRAGAGDRIFVNGGSGGTGTLGIQVARALGCRVAASCSAANAGLCRSLGADEVVDYAREDVCAALTALAASSSSSSFSSSSPSSSSSGDQNRLFRLVVDNVGASPPDLHAAADRFLDAEGGRFVQVGGEPTLAGLRALASRALLPALLGGGSRPWEFVITRNDAGDLARLAAWAAEGKLRPVVDEVFAFGDAPAAYAKLKTGRARGKIVVRVSE